MNPQARALTTKIGELMPPLDCKGTMNDGAHCLMVFIAMACTSEKLIEAVSTPSSLQQVPKCRYATNRIYFAATLFTIVRNGGSRLPRGTMKK